MNAPGGMQAAFELHTEVVAASELRVLEWTCAETICGSYRIDAVIAVAAAAGDDLGTKLLGQRAIFAAHQSAAPTLVRRGVVASVDAAGSYRRDRAELHVSIVPRLELMRLHTTSRIFESTTTGDLLKALAKEWQFEADVRLTGSYNPRTYTTQYRESDYAFLQRIAARDGIGFFIEHRELADSEPGQIGTERVVFYDNTEAYPEIAAPSDGARGARLAHHPAKFAALEHHVEHFRLSRRVSTESVALSDFDFRKPRLPLRAAAKVETAVRTPIGSALGADQLTLSTHADRAELDPTAKANVELSEPVAIVRLQQARRDAAVGKGKSRCSRLAPGHTFMLEEHPDLASLNRELVVTKIVHRGVIPETSAEGETALLYSNEFECVPAEVVYRTDVPNLDVRQASETATVVGPKGADVHCDEHGRIKVQFHWDFSGASGDMRTIWLRVASSWAGAGWGSQFIPRVGMEVLVGFLGGDVDRPIVVGSVYNGTHPLPFPMPEGARKSGFRTLSTPGGDGGNELSFDDTKGEEKIFVHAEKDLSQHVDNNFDLIVKGGQNVHVEGSSTHTVGASTMDILGDCTQRIEKNFESTISGSQSVTVTGTSDLRVAGARNTRVEGSEKLELFGSSESVFHEDTVQRALGHHITVVGQNGARRSATLHVEGSAYQYTTGTSEIVADKVIVLRCGESSIRMTPEGIDIVAKTVRLQAEKIETNSTDTVTTFAKKQIAFVCEGKIDLIAKKKIVAKAEEGVLALDKNARLDGAMVKLNCDPEKPDELEAPEYEPPKPTKIELADETGKPLGQRRYVIVEKDGAERSGMLNEEGKAELFLEESAEVFFPDVDDARPE